MNLYEEYLDWREDGNETEESPYEIFRSGWLIGNARGLNQLAEKSTVCFLSGLCAGGCFVGGLWLLWG